jgi:hypothetical protein
MNYLENEDDPSFDSKYQREIRLAEEFPSFCSANIFYKQFQMKGNTGSVFSMTNKKIKKCLPPQLHCYMLFTAKYR